MSTSNTRKAAFLGMPYGTAANRLRKMLMFKFAQELGHDECFACGEKIETAEDLSVEHKEPWLDRENGIELFWDLDNIAFSHRKCNIPHDRSRPTLRKVAPEGMAWCANHQKFMPIKMFHRDSKRWNGYFNYCKPCGKEKYGRGYKI